MRQVKLFVFVIGTACHTAKKQQVMSIEQSTMKTSHCTFGLENCPSFGSTKGVYEAAHSALEDCLTGCMDDNQTNDRSDENVREECALICDQSSYLELIPTPTSIDIQVLEQ